MGIDNQNSGDFDDQHPRPQHRHGRPGAGFLRRRRRLRLRARLPVWRRLPLHDRGELRLQLGRMNEGSAHGRPFLLLALSWPGLPAADGSPPPENQLSICRAVGATPNIRLKVRLRCAESENPASCAAAVSDDPAATIATARLSLNQRR